MKLGLLLSAITLLVPAATRASEPPAVPARRSAEPPDVPLDAVVQCLVRDLGAERYDEREQATESLRHIGQPALAAVKAAAKSDDPEVRLRAQDILGDLELGIGSDWPPEIALLIRHYDRLNQQERNNALQSISAALGARSVPFLLDRMADGDQNEGNYAVYMLQRMNTEDVWRQVIRLAKEPKNEFQARALAWARGQSGQAIDALDAFADAQLNALPRDKAVEAALQDVLRLLRQGKPQEALAAAEKGAKATPAEARFLYLQAEALIALNKDKQALALRDQALALNPDKEAPHALAGETLAAMGRARLAAREWQRVLDIEPNDSPTDTSACLRLAAIHAASGLFAPAAQYMEKAIQRFAKLKEEAPDGQGVPAGAIESLQIELGRLQSKAQQYPTPAEAPIEAPLPDSEFSFAVTVKLKEGKLEDLQRAVAAAAAQFRLTVQPADLRLFDLPAASLRYDKAKKQILVLLHDTPVAKPLPYEAKAKVSSVALHTADVTYIVQVDAEAGTAERIAQFDKDYVVALRPGVKLSAYADVSLRLNGSAADWDDIRKGISYDRLPQQFDVVLEGTTPTGRRITAHVTVDAQEPKLEPPAPAPAKPTS